MKFEGIDFHGQRQKYLNKNLDDEFGFLRHLKSNY